MSFQIPGGFQDVGAGRSLAPADLPKPRVIALESWRDGIRGYGPLSQIAPSAGLLRGTQDMDVWFDGALCALPGVLEIEDVDPRSLRYLFQQASLDYGTELVAIDPPHVGYKGVLPFTFDDLSIEATGANGWNATNVAGTLIFSNGSTATYTREPLASTVTDISAEVVARTFATAFGRAFAGAYTDPISGLQSLGIKWNAASGAVDDWSGTGANEELLISNSLEADRVVALRALGFDALGVLCRNSLWIGYPTSDPNRPADFRVRFTGNGCVAEPTAVVTPYGVVYLSDEGVCRFDTNSAEVISDAINAVLLPLDTVNLSKYIGLYDPNRRRYQLLCPDGTVWLYEFAHEGYPAKWLRRATGGADNMAVFTDQTPNVFWSTVIGTWAQQLLTWAEMVQSQSDAPPRIYYVRGSLLGRIDTSTNEFLGEPMVPEWQIPEANQGLGVEEFTTQKFVIEYYLADSQEATIELRCVNTAGDIDDQVFEVVLPASALTLRKRKTIDLPLGGSTGKGTQFAIRITAGRPRILALKQVVMDNNPGTESLAAS